MSNWHGRYSKTQLNAAAKHLGLRVPVRVKATAGKHLPEDSLGYHSPYGLVADEPHHTIMLRMGRPLYEVDDTVAHELIHAQQWERDPGAMMRLASRSVPPAEDPVAYLLDPREREANRRAPGLAAKFSIARPGKVVA